MFFLELNALEKVFSTIHFAITAKTLIRQFDVAFIALEAFHVEKLLLDPQHELLQYCFQTYRTSRIFNLNNNNKKINLSNARFTIQ